MINRSDLIKDDLASMQFLGEVVDTADPEHAGRCRVRVFGKFDELKDEDLPWATPRLDPIFGKGGGGASLSVPRKGAVVQVSFNNGNLYAPEYTGLQEVSSDLTAEIAGSYENAAALIYDGDENLRVYYTRQKGLTLWLKESRVNIASDNSITIEHKGTSAIIELRGNNITVTADSEVNVTAGTRAKVTAPEVWADGKQTKLGHVPAYSAVLAEPLWAFLKTLAAAVDAKMYPTPGAMMSAATAAEQLSTSTTVKVAK